MRFINDSLRDCQGFNGIVKDLVRPGGDKDLMMSLRIWWVPLGSCKI